MDSLKTRPGLVHLRKVDKKIFRRHCQRLRQLYDVFESYVSLPPLHSADIVPMEARALGKLFLRKAALVAKTPQRCAETRLNGTDSHTPMVEA